MATRILIVEDQAVIALGLKRELTALGHEVVAIADQAAAAVKAASELKPDLVLMDIGLDGDVDGIAVASAIRGYEDIPIIFLTAHADKATLERALAASPFGYILKPFETPQIEAAIKVALYKHGKEVESRRHLQEVTRQAEKQGA